MKAVLQVREVARSGERRLDGIAPLVHPEVGVQAVPATGPDHELPQPGRLGEGVRVGAEAALDHAQVDEIERQALFLQDVAHERHEPRAAPEPLGEMHARVGLEEADVGDHRVVQLDGDVVFGAQLVLGDAGQLGETQLRRARRRRIGERRAVDRGALRGGQVAGQRIPGVEPDGEPVARACARRLRQQARLLLGPADCFELGRALVHLGLRFGIVRVRGVRFLPGPRRGLARLRRSGGARGGGNDGDCRPVEPGGGEIRCRCFGARRGSGEEQCDEGGLLRSSRSRRQSSSTFR